MFAQCKKMVCSSNLDKKPRTCKALHHKIKRIERNQPFYPLKQSNSNGGDTGDGGQGKGSRDSDGRVLVSRAVGTGGGVATRTTGGGVGSIADELEGSSTLKVGLSITQALGDGLHDQVLGGIGNGQDAADGNIDLLREEIVLEDDETSLHGRDLDQPGLESIDDGLSGSSLSRDVPVVGVKVLGPDGGLVTELGGDGTDTVIDISVRGAPVDGGDANDGLDSLLGPLQFSDNLLVGEGGHGGVGPGVDGDVVTVVVGALEGLGEGDGAGSDDEEGGLLAVGQQVVVQARRVRGWAVY